MDSLVISGRDPFNVLGISRELDALGDIAYAMVQNTTLGGSAHAFAQLPTHIPAFTLPPVAGRGPALIWDIGGTHTRIYLEEDGRWLSIADIIYTAPEVAKRLDSAEDPLSDFAFLSMEKVAASGISSVRGGAIVWSNAARSIPLNPMTDGVRGVTMEVCERNTAYNKHEPFVEKLQDGHYLHSYFTSAARRTGVAVPALVFLNDVPASFEKNAGMVASTGANGTLVIDGEMCNSELGALFNVPSDMLSTVEQERYPDGLCLEEVMAGKGIAKRFRDHMTAIAETQRVSDGFHALAERLKKHAEEESAARAGGRKIDVEYFKTEDLSTLIRFQKRKDRSAAAAYTELIHRWGISAGDAPKVADLAESLVERAGLLAGFMAWITLSNQNGSEDEEKVVGLESSLARNVPGYSDNMQKAFEQLRGSAGGRIHVLRPLDLADGTQVSAPALGAEKALRHFVV